MTGLVIGGGAGLVIALLVMLKSGLPSRQLRRARKRFQNLVRKSVPSSRVSIFGGNYVHPVVWIRTSTDGERTILQQDTNLVDQFRAILAGVGYPGTDIRLVQFVFESQETVDRQFGGKWSRRRFLWHREGV